jgi:hypothetical protein
MGIHISNPGGTKIATGTYTGDGNATQAIVIGFKPKAVSIYDSSNPEFWFATADIDIRGDVIIAEYETHALGTHVSSLNANGFSVVAVGAQTDFPNVAAETYAFVAWG